ncbi:phage replisome organizer N-terminal domain-containing protein [Lactococcus fujiensis]|uniref:phage replisome organizer N-terminal domain-containing protein n=1 Tax=Lactococcus fujiensis TaxID=610251 RepID=UPI0006D0226A|nr:phage replisome organizer N-terminal domain-containing protein [Lactococcus fujiensis]
MPENDAIFRIWVFLLSMAGKTNDSGLIYLSDDIPYTDEMIATLCDRPISIVRLALNTFKKFGMIEIYQNGILNITNWGQHQNLDGMDKIREQQDYVNRANESEKKAKNY